MLGDKPEKLFRSLQWLRVNREATFTAGHFAADQPGLFQDAEVLRNRLSG